MPPQNYETTGLTLFSITKILKVKKIRDLKVPELRILMNRINEIEVILKKLPICSNVQQTQSAELKRLVNDWIEKNGIF